MGKKELHSHSKYWSGREIQVFQSPQGPTGQLPQINWGKDEQGGGNSFAEVCAVGA